MERSKDVKMTKKLSYETVGVAAQDLVAAKVIYDKAVEAGKRTSLGRIIQEEDVSTKNTEFSRVFCILKNSFVIK